jgi:hypothetical protein
MQVFELADDLKVETEALIALLRQMGIPITDEDATITDGQMAKVLAKVERERRAGHKDPSAAIRAALEDASPSGGKRRRRRKADVEEEPEPEAEEAEEVEEAGAEEAAAPVRSGPRCGASTCPAGPRPCGRSGRSGSLHPSAPAGPRGQRRPRWTGSHPGRGLHGGRPPQAQGEGQEGQEARGRGSG